MIHLEFFRGKHNMFHIHTQSDLNPENYATGRGGAQIKQMKIVRLIKISCAAWSDHGRWGLEFVLEV